MVGRTLAYLLVAVVAGLLVFMLAAPRLLPPTEPPSSPKVTAQGAGEDSSPVSSASHGVTPPSAPSSHEAIDAPRTPEQRYYESVESRREPFYRQIRQAIGEGLRECRPTADDQATLDLYYAQDGPDVAQQLLFLVAQAAPYRYGYRRIRFYLPNPPDMVDRYHLDSEATPDAQGAWRAYKK